MRHYPHLTEAWLYELCKEVHDEGSGFLGEGKADWPVASLSDELLEKIKRAELMGYVETRERMDLGADRIVVRLTPQGHRLVKTAHNDQRPTVAQRIASLFRRS